MPQQQLWDLTEVPAGWPLATVIDAFAYLAADDPSLVNATRALEAVSHRLVDLWASQPQEAEAWLQRCRELFATELAGQETRPELLSEALLRHGAAEWGKYSGWCSWRFSEAGLLRGEPRGSAAERERRAAAYLQEFPFTRDRCEELAERLGQAESPETARKRQKLEEETAERRRLEAELHKAQEEGRDLRNRLAAAEAGLSSKEAELQAAQNETAKCKEQCEELRCRARSAESALAETRQELEQVHERCADLSARLEAAEVEVEHAKAQERLAHDAAEKQLEDTLAEMRIELQQAQDKHCKSQERRGDLAGRLEVAEAGAVLHTRTKERLAEAESDVVAKQVQPQQLQDYQARRFLSAAEEGESKAELQLEKAVLQERCEQLRQQLDKAEAKVDLLPALHEEIGMYKERNRGLERQLAETKRNQRLCGAISGRPSMSHPGPARSHVAFGDQESELAEQLGYSLVDEDVASVLSASSGYVVKENCFMLDAIFKSRMDFFREGRDLQKGSQVLAGDGKTVLEVVEISKEGQATEVVDLQAGAATLRVTPDHPVQVPDEGGEAGRHLYMPAGKLKAGDFVMLDSGEPVALTSAETQPAECKVLKIVFKPDLPVAVFSSPSCILSKGHKKKSQVRRAGGGKGKEAADPMDGGASIPDTAAGEYMD